MGAARNKENFEGIGGGGGGGGGGFRIKLQRVVSPQPELGEEGKGRSEEGETRDDTPLGSVSESGFESWWHGEKLMQVGEKERKKCEVKRAKRTIIA